LGIQPETFLEKDNNVTSSIFGIPLSTADIKESKVLWTPTNTLNQDYEVPIRPVYNGTDIIV
jgi:hypothetical protein